MSGRKRVQSCWRMQRNLNDCFEGFVDSRQLGRGQDQAGNGIAAVALCTVMGLSKWLPHRRSGRTIHP